MRGIAHALLALLFVASATPTAADTEFPAVVPGYSIELPRDEGSHPQFRTEWWYLTGWVESESGEPFGFQLTFFRNRPGVDEDNPSRFVARQVLFAHAAVSDQRRGALLRGEKSARAGFGLAESALRLLAEQQTMFEAMWQRLTLAQRSALRAVVLENGLEILSGDTRTRHRLAGPSSVQSALAALQRDDVIAREGERYVVVDSLVREWVARKTF